jgi:hypothetical protein
MPEPAKRRFIFAFPDLIDIPLFVFPISSLSAIAFMVWCPQLFIPLLFPPFFDDPVSTIVNEK